MIRLYPGTCVGIVVGHPVKGDEVLQTEHNLRDDPRGVISSRIGHTLEKDQKINMVTE